MPYPLPVFHFKVEIAGLTAEFSEVTGLNIEVQVIEYRHGLSPDYSTTKMPGIQKYGNITLKRGVVKGNNEFFDFYKKIKMNTVERQDVLISLLDEEHSPVMQWRVREAWPTKLTSPDLKANGNEVAIETMELAHEGFTILNE
jgi:phage tail-like protein